MAVEYIYGINPAFELMRAGRRTIRRACVAEGARPAGRLRSLLDMLAEKQCPVEHVPKTRLFELCRSADHQGVVLETDPYPYASFAECIGHGRILLLDNVEDPQNVGAILRSAEVFGWRHVLLSRHGTAGIYPSVAKSSAGACEHLLIARDHSANYYVREAMKSGYVVVALDGGGKMPIDDLLLPPGARVILVIGGEHRAVGQLILNTAQYVVKIPLRGRISSLNASVAAGVAMHAIRP